MNLDDVTTVGDVGEFNLIRRITDGLSMPPAVSVGPGDDAACLLVDGSCVVSTDMFVEGVHFRRDWSTATDMGRKVVAASVADIEAMGASPLIIVVALGLPRNTTQAWADEFNNALLGECDRARVSLAGGDLSSAPQITVTVTAVGETGGLPAITRSGARPGQVVAVNGRLGWAAAGLAALGRGFRSPKAVVDAYRYPLVPYGAGRQAALAGATSMIDVSDGLLADLGHIAIASGVAIDLDSSYFTIADPVLAVGQALGVDPLAYALTGGEDHALAATFGMGDVPKQWRVIGRVAPVGTLPPGSVLVDGRDWGGPSTGWRHF